MTMIDPSPGPDALTDLAQRLLSSGNALIQAEAERDLLQDAITRMRWQPIETARPATNLYLFDPEIGVCIGRFVPTATGVSRWLSGCGFLTPTHWMPLPAPPPRDDGTTPQESTT